jgi:hypothetical protein
VCPKREKQLKLNFIQGSKGKKACIPQTRHQKTNFKSRQHILREITQYSKRNTGTTEVIKMPNKRN